MTAAETSMLSTYEESRVACLPGSFLNYGLEELAHALVKQFLRAQSYRLRCRDLHSHVPNSTRILGQVWD